MLPRRAAAVCLWALVLGVLSAAPLAAQAQRPAGGRTRVIVELRLASPHVGEGRLANAPARAAQRREIAEAGARVTARLNAADHRLVRRYQTVPYVAIEASPAALAALRAAPDVVRVFDDEIVHAVLAQSVPQIQADQAWASGYDGSGTTIAILDTGVDGQHPFLAGKVVAEACFSSTVSALSQSTCPNGSDQQLGAGAGIPCSLSDCLHGTHVAGIAAGRGPVAGASFSGVARGANLIAIQVFSRITDAAECGGVAPCAGAFSSDVIAGLEYTLHDRRASQSCRGEPEPWRHELPGAVRRPAVQAGDRQPPFDRRRERHRVGQRVPTATRSHLRGACPPP